MSRLSIVDDIYMPGGLASSSNLQIGDSHEAHLESRVLAVQKEVAVYRGSEGDLTLFDIFTQKLPTPDLNHEHIQMTRHDEVPVIKVGRIRVTSAASASLIHIGSSDLITTDSRVKHFRHYQHVPKGYKERPELTIHTESGSFVS